VPRPAADDVSGSTPRTSNFPGVPLYLLGSSDLGVGGFVDASFVGDHDQPGAGCDASLQTAFGLFGGLAFHDLLVEVSSPSIVGHTNLGDATRWSAALS